MTIDSKNNLRLFSASLLFRSSHDDDRRESSLWEEAIILIEALNEVEAAVKAKEIGLTMQSSYVTLDSTSVTWLFFKVERIFELLDIPLQHGSELFSRHLRNSEVQSILTPFE